MIPQANKSEKTPSRKIEMEGPRNREISRQEMIPAKLRQIKSRISSGEEPSQSDVIHRVRGNSNTNGLRGLIPDRTSIELVKVTPRINTPENGKLYDLKKRKAEVNSRKTICIFSENSVF